MQRFVYERIPALSPVAREAGFAEVLGENRSIDANAKLDLTAFAFRVQSDAFDEQIYNFCPSRLSLGKGYTIVAPSVWPRAPCSLLSSPGNGVFPT